MTTIEHLLDEKVFQTVKQDFVRQIHSTSKTDIINNTDKVIEQLQKANSYEPIDIDWDAFKVTGQTTDYFSVDNLLLSQSYFPHDRITGHIFTFSSTVNSGDKRLLDFISENIVKNRHGLYRLTVNGKIISFDFVVFGNPHDAQIITQKRNELKDHLKRAINELNEKSMDFKKAIDELIVLETNLVKKRYIDSDNFFGTIDGIK